MQHSGSGEKGFWTTKTFVFVLVYGLLWTVTGYTTLLYYHHHVNELEAHAPKAAPASQAQQSSAKSEEKAPAVATASKQKCDTAADDHSAPTYILDIMKAFWTPYPCTDAFKALHSLHTKTDLGNGNRVASGQDKSTPAATQKAVTKADQPFPPNASMLDQHTALYNMLDAPQHPKQTLNTALYKIGIVVLISGFWIFTFQAANQYTHAWMRDHVSWFGIRYRQWRAALSEFARPHLAKPIALLRDLRMRLHHTLPVLPPGFFPSIARLFRFMGDAADQLISAPVVIKVIAGLLSLIPVFPFVVAMSIEYEPAVLVMALVAIFVAGEHYGGLTETEHELQTRTEELHSRIGIILDADGLNQWRTEIYQLYSKAEYRIDAVIRSFDIDTLWWMCANETNKWDAYINAGASEDTSLLYTLKKTRACVQFVADLPLQPDVVAGRTAAGAKAKFFRDLLGLAWHLVVFEEVHQHRLNVCITKPPEHPPYLRIKIGHAPCWMHVIDDIVYQIIERGTAGNATVRQLSASITDPQARTALARWARDNVRRLARQGGRAEEYLFALMHYAAIRRGCRDNDLVLDVMEKILDTLGMDHYLVQPNEDFLLVRGVSVNPRMNRSVLLHKEQAKDLCVAVFAKLIEQRFSKNACHVDAWCTRTPEVGHLASETL